ncbi:hypothetical protein MASR2M47_43530 [Draconibacterium sp.]
MGNTNLTLQTYSDDEPNSNNNMVYVDVDGDANTKNSSSATLQFSTENGAVPACSNIIYAGLYWTGRAHDGGESPLIFNVGGSATNYNNNANIGGYTLAIAQSQSGSVYTATYTFTPTSGNSVIFTFITTGSTVNSLTVKVGSGGTPSNVPYTSSTSFGSRVTVAFDNPYVINTGSTTITVNELRKVYNTTSINTNFYANVTTGGKTFNKLQVKLKHGTSAYQTVTANSSDILYPTSQYGNMYSAYAEVTEYVQQHGLGSYTVGDIALVEGNGTTTGFYGGWGMIVVYENSKMKWRDVTIFDGYAYVPGLTSYNAQLAVSGFNTTQSGNVNMKMGMIAGEGDRTITGDYFDILPLNTGSNWVKLDHGGNTGDANPPNFFNSSIYTGGNARNPNLLNNTGLDIAMFDIPNINNTIIANNQTSTTFRYGTTQDTYIIFCIAMSVDAYRPEIEGINKVTKVNGSPYTYPGGGNVNPEDIITYTVDIANLGSESIVNGKLIIPVPYTAEFNSVSFQNYHLTGYGTPVYNASLGANGSIVWDLGTLPIPPVAGTKLATLTFTLKVTDDCKTLALALGCEFLVSVDGTISGVGAVSNVPVSSSLIQGYQIAGGQCEGLAISAPIVIPVDAVAYFEANCAGTPTTPEFNYCNTGATIPVTEVSGFFPVGTRFYNTSWTTEYNISNPFPATPGSITYNAVPPGVSAPPEEGQCSYTFSINVTTLTTTPTPINEEYCQDEQADPLEATPTNLAYVLYYYTEATGGSAQTSITPSTTTPGVTTYYVAEGLSGACKGPRVPLTVTVHPKPDCSISGNDGPVCPSSSIDYSAPSNMKSYAWSILGNGTISGATNNQTVQVIAGTNCNAAYTLTLVTTNNFDCSEACEKVVMVNDTEAPTASNPADIVLTGCNGIFPAADIAVVTDEADNCGTPVVAFVGDGTPSLVGCTETTIRTYSVTDACNNSINVKQSLIRIVDGENPILTLPSTGLALGCNPTTLPTVASVVAASSATDNCGTPVITAVAGEITGECEKTQIFTVTATDGCNNKDIETVTYTWSDDAVAPELTVPSAGLALGCNPATLPTVASVEAASSATDNCGTPVITAVAGEITGECEKTQIFTVTATDGCNNKDIETVTYTWSDDAVAPELTVPGAGLALGCNPTTLPTVASVVAASSATDNCGTPVITAVAGEIAGECEKTQTFTVTATDGCNNKDIETVTYTWSDDAVAPELTVPGAGLALGCNPTTLPTVASVVAASSATDNCGTPVITAVAGEITGTCEKNQIFTVTATDGCGNKDIETVTYTWSDDAVAPELSVPSTGLALGCNPTTLPTVASVEAASSATDNCGTPVITAVAGDVTGDCLKTQIFTVTATDGCNNIDVETVTYTWTADAVDPELTVPSTGLALGCNPQTLPTETSVIAASTATDNCGTPVITAVAGEITGTCEKTQIFTVTATDGCNNMDIETVTYTWSDDAVAPELTVPGAGLALGCNPTTLPTVASVEAASSATDNCGTPVITAVAGEITGECEKTQTFTVTATDGCNNKDIETVTYTWSDDAVAPELTVPGAGLALGCNPTTLPTVASVVAASSATDNCGTPVITAVAGEITGECEKTQIFTVTATDGCNNKDIETVTYTWSDDAVAPEFHRSGRQACFGLQPDNAADSCKCCGCFFGHRQLWDTCNHGRCRRNYRRCEKTQTFTVTATDGCNNKDIETVTYTWSDDAVAPELTVPGAGLALGCNPTTLPTVASVVAASSATDNCGTPVITAVAGEITGECEKTQIFTVTATDGCNNKDIETVTYTWSDDAVAPELTVPGAGLALGCNPTTLPTVASVEAASSATDNCGTPVITAVAGEITGECEKTQTFTVTATDGCNNKDIETVTYTWSDDAVAPELTVPSTGLALGCNPATLPTVVSVVAASSATDNCGTPIITAVAGEITGTCEKNQIFTVTATDGCNNMDIETVTYTWSDDAVAPSLTVPSTGLALGCNPTTLPTVASVVAASSATDNCGTPVITAVAGEITGECEKTQIFTVTATDGCNNKDIETVTYTWSDDAVAPELTVPGAGLALGCNPTTLPTVASVVAASSATDNCGTPVITAVAGEITGECEKTQTFTVTATDGCNNKDIETVTYTWSDDSEDPSFTGCPAEVVTWTGIIPPTCTDALALVSVSDVCSANIIPTCDAGEIEIDGCERTQTFSLTATDGCNNTATCAVTFTWIVDDEEPVFNGCPSEPIALGCNPIAPECSDALALVTVTDGCSGTLTPTCSAGTITENGCQRSQIFTLTATDDQNNKTTCEVTYTWSDDAVAPELTVPGAGLALGCNPTTLPTVASVVAASSATDNCGTPVITAVAGEITGECEKTQIFTVTATDGCNNKDIETVTYTWSDDAVAPELTVPGAGLALGCNPTTLPTVASVVAASSATDNCGTPVITAVAGEITGECEKTQTFTVTATDGCNNKDIETVTYTWSDDAVAPELTVPGAGLALGCNPTTLPTVASVVAASSATDNCGTPVITAVAGEITGECEKTQIFTVTATDGCNNKDIETVTYTWSDDAVAPELTVPGARLAFGLQPDNAANSCKC